MTAAAPFTEPRNIRVLIGADQMATREGVRLALADSAECSEAATTDDAVAKAVHDRPDICFFVFEPARLGIRAAGEVTARVPNAAVIVITPQLNEDEFLSAVRAGVSGYLSQAIDPSRLPHVVRGVMRGEAAVPRTLTRRLLEELQGGGRRRRLALHGQRHDELTRREWDVVEGLQQGMSTREIADILRISQVTVRRHTSSLTRKFGVKSRSELLRLLSTEERGET